MLGSVTEKVVRTAPCPVITVPPPMVATSRLPFKQVLCGIDFSEPSMIALRFAMSMAIESNSTLTLLHVLEFPPDGGDALETLPFDMASYRAAVRADATNRLMELITDEARQGCQPVDEVGARTSRTSRS